MIALPISFENKMKKILGPEFASFSQSLDNPSPISIRLHPKKQTNKFDSYDPVPWNSYGRYLENRPSFTHDPLFQAGAYYVQEASSMSLRIALESLELERNIKALDLCAAPGGKTTLISDFINSRNNDADFLIANEVIKPRANILSQNVTKWGYSNTLVCSHDPKYLADNLENYFDVIVADCPCSGEGLFRKDINARSEWSEDNVDLCDLRQKRILSEAMRLLKPGGYIIYSTCTYNNKENINQVHEILKSFNSESLEVKGLSDHDITEVKEKEAIGYQFYPHKQHGEGFFISVIRKNGGMPMKSRKTKKQKVPKNIPLDFIPKKMIVVEGKDEQLHAVHIAHIHEFTYLSKILWLKNYGLHIGKLIKHNIIPSHDLSLSCEVESPFPSIEVDKEIAVQFMMKKDINIEGAIGWNRISYEGLGLGWIKKLPKRINNYYPKNLRILNEER